MPNTAASPLQITLNGEPRPVAAGLHVSDLVQQLSLDIRKVAVERNLAIVPRDTYAATPIMDGDRIEIVGFIGGGYMRDPFLLAGREFQSRLLVGSGKYQSLEIARDATAASGAEIITVALRRINLASNEGARLQELIPPTHYTYLPNSAGCYTAEEAVRTMALARELGGWDLVKLEVIGDKQTLLPDVGETIRAARMLVADGFKVMAYITDDPIACAELEKAGCVAVMPLASPIGSGLGIRNPNAIRRIVDQSKIPVLVDAGIGTASDATIAMELGCDAVLLNSAIAEARDPVAMAAAMKLAVEAGRQAYLAGRMPQRNSADASSPTTGLIQTA